MLMSVYWSYFHKEDQKAFSDDGQENHSITAVRPTGEEPRTFSLQC